MTSRPERDDWGPAAHLVEAAAFGTALAFMAYVTYRALRDHYVIPYVDDWRILDQLFSEALPGWLFSGQNGHRMPVTLALLALDFHWLEGHMHLLVAAALACAWLAVVPAWTALRRHVHRPPWAGVLAFTGFALFWAGSCYDFAWGTNHGSQQATLLLWVALAALAAYQSRRCEGGRTGGGLVAVAALAAVGATFSQAAGAASWGALLAVALVARFPGRVTIALALVAVATVVVYRHGLAIPVQDPLALYAATLRKHPWALLGFVASFIGIAPSLVVDGGAPAAPSNTPGLGFGVAGLAGLALWTTRLLVRREPMSRPQVVALGLMTFAAAAGLLVALNRMAFGMVGYPRWVTWSTLFWIGAAWAIGSLVAAWRWTGHLFVAALAAVALLAQPALWTAHRQQRAIRGRLEKGAQLLVLGIRGELRGHFPFTLARPEVVYRVSDRLQQDGRSFFADPVATLPGTALDERFVKLPTGRCRGAIRTIERLDTEGDPAVRLQGVAWDDALQAAPDYIVVVDPGARVRGLGAIAPAPRRDGWVTEAHWSGYIRAPYEANGYVVYGVLDDGRAVCPITEVSGARLLAAPLAVPPPGRTGSPRAAPR